VSSFSSSSSSLFSSIARPVQPFNRHATAVFYTFEAS